MDSDLMAHGAVHSYKERHMAATLFSRPWSCARIDMNRCDLLVWFLESMGCSLETEIEQR